MATHPPIIYARAQVGLVQHESRIVIAVVVVVLCRLVFCALKFFVLCILALHLFKSLVLAGDLVRHAVHVGLRTFNGFITSVPSDRLSVSGACWGTIKVAEVPIFVRPGAA